MSQVAGKRLRIAPTIERSFACKLVCWSSSQPRYVLAHFANIQVCHLFPESNYEGTNTW